VDVKGRKVSSRDSKMRRMKKKFAKGNQYQQTKGSEQGLRSPIIVKPWLIYAGTSRSVDAMVIIIMLILVVHHDSMQHADGSWQAPRSCRCSFDEGISTTDPEAVSPDLGTLCTASDDPFESVCKSLILTLIKKEEATVQLQDLPAYSLSASKLYNQFRSREYQPTLHRRSLQRRWLCVINIVAAAALVSSQLT